MEPTRGAIAVCSRGELGLIQSKQPVRVVYNQCDICASVYQAVQPEGDCTCEEGIAWTGIHSSDAKFGQPWSSRNPLVLLFVPGDLDRHEQTKLAAFVDKLIASRVA